ILIGPEPGNSIIAAILTHDIHRSDLGLIIGILHRFEPYVSSASVSVSMCCTITDGIDTVQTCAAILVDINAVASSRTGSDQRAGFGNDANTNDKHISIQYTPVRQLYTRCHAGI